MINDFTKKEAPILSTLGLGGGNASRLFLSGAVLSNRSLRFNSSDTTNLTRTFSSSGNRQSWTWSGWVKRSALVASERQVLFGGYGANSDTGWLEFGFGQNNETDDSVYMTTSSTSQGSTAVFRDVAAWYHYLVNYDGSNLKIYINNVLILTKALTGDRGINGNWLHTIGKSPANTIRWFNGYLTDVYFIDGSTLTPSSFGSDDSNGVWQRSTYSGSYGTNGFHILDFANNETIGSDTSGNGNTFTANNFSTTAGSGNDVLFDFPTNDTVNTDSGAGGEVIGNYCVFNSLNKGNDVTLSNGNLQAACTSSSKDGVFGTIGVSSGKYYWEVELTSADGNTNAAIGVALGSLSPDAASPTSAGAYFYSSYNGNKWLSSADSSYGASYTTGDIIGVALDLDNTTLTFYKNGVSQGNATTSLPSGTYFPYVGDNANNSAQTVVANWGQRAFSYSAPSNFKCLTSTSLPTPTISDGSDYFKTSLYTGNGGTTTVTGTQFSPDFVWIKKRNSGSSHFLYDTNRGTQKILSTNYDGQENWAGGGSAAGELTSFTSDGFTIVYSGSYGGNDNNDTYVAWQWEAGSSTVSNTNGSVTSQVRANQSAGVSVVTYTNPSSGAFTVGHGLNADVGMIITKHRNRTSDWYVWHSAFTSEDDYINLNSTAAKGTATDFWGASPPGNSTFGGKIGTSALAGDTDVAYCFAPVDGYQALGEFTGNADNGNGPFVYTGFAVQWLLIKGYNDSNDNWKIFDNSRSTFNVADDWIAANNSNAETTSNNNKVDFLSNGFKIRTDSSGDSNLNNKKYLYLAIAENPLQANGGLAR